MYVKCVARFCAHNLIVQLCQMPAHLVLFNNCTKQCKFQYQSVCDIMNLKLVHHLISKTVGGIIDHGMNLILLYRHNMGFSSLFSGYFNRLEQLFLQQCNPSENKFVLHKFTQQAEYSFRHQPIKAVHQNCFCL